MKAKTNKQKLSFNTLFQIMPEIKDQQAHKRLR